jgi:hypothetical protein
MGDASPVSSSRPRMKLFELNLFSPAYCRRSSYFKELSRENATSTQVTWIGYSMTL